MPVLIMVTSASFTQPGMTDKSQASCVTQRVIGARASFSAVKPFFMSHVTSGARFHSYVQRNVKNMRVVTCTRIYTYYSVISVSSVIRRGKIAMTLAMTLLRMRSQVSLAKGGLRHA